MMTKIVNEESFTIGRSVDCIISLSEESISRVHLVVTRRGSQIWLEDKNSSNGTFVNDIKIAGGVPMLIVPTDLVRVGKSDYILNIDLQAEDDMVQAVLSTPVLQAKAQQKQPLLQVQLHVEKNNLGLSDEDKKVEVDPAQAAQTFESEKLIHEARKKAAQIIYEGEAQAEKRVQAIYAEAQNKKSDADTYYQKKITTAHKEADAIIVNFQTQGQELILQARHVAQEIRDEVEVYIQSVKEKTKKEMDKFIEETHEECEVIKHEVRRRTLDEVENDANNILSAAKAEAADLVNFARMQAEEMSSKAQKDLETEFEDLRKQVEERHRHLVAAKKEEEEFNIRAQGDKEEYEAKIAEHKDLLEKLQAELSTAQMALAETRQEDFAARNKIDTQEKTITEIKSSIFSLNDERKNLEGKNKELQDRLGHFKLEIQSAEERKKSLENEVAQQRAQLKDKLEKEHQQILKNSEERIQDAHLEMGKRLEKLEKDMFDEILSRKDNLVKEIIVVVETRIAKVLEPAKWDQVSGIIFESVQALIEGKSVSVNEGNALPKQSVSLQRKKKQEHLRWLSMGVVMGLILAVGGWRGYTTIQQDQTPMRTLANEESKARKDDLERRKFNPPQTPELKDNYVDSVIYTSNFVTSYSDPEFQKKYYKAASTYLLKTWRVDEDASIQVLSIANALVKELSDKRQAIHPDYVKDGIAKMRLVETQGLARMKGILGSEVRLESLRRFERKFYEQEVLKRGVASETP